MKKQITKTAVLSALVSGLCVTGVYADEANEHIGFQKGMPPVAVAIIAVAAVILAIAALIVFRHNRGGCKPSGAGVDRLTGLGNRKHVRGYYNGLDEYESASSCFIYTSFDFAQFAEKYGCEKAEELQKSAAGTIISFCGDSDCASRIGDGEYVIVTNCRNGVVAQQRINSLTENLNERISKSYGKTDFSFHSGFYMAEAERVSFDTALRYSRLGFEHAIENEMLSYVFTHELLKNETNRKNLKDKLSKAIDSGEFEMFLQLIYNVKENKFTCAEVLSRWNSPTDGFLMPAYYINDLRTTGLINKFDMYMLDKTCRLLEEWGEGEFSGINLSCNITRTTISSPDFYQSFKNVIKKYRFDHSRLALEVTEDALIDKTVAYQNLASCKNDGVFVAIDDFCAGNSTLEDISDYPIDIIKLDRHLIARTTTERGNVLIEEMIRLCHRMGMEVVCEGVETEAQKKAVLANGTDYVQGYFFSYVLPVEEAKERYRQPVSFEND